jgi:acyl carrier protein
LSATQHNVESDPEAQEVLGTVTELLELVIGDEYELDVDVTMETSFADDIELESIEFVRLSELLQERYGSRVDFVAWFSELDVDQIIGLTVGELVEFIRRETRGAPSGA